MNLTHDDDQIEKVISPRMIDPSNEQIDQALERWVEGGMQSNPITEIIDQVIIDELKALAGK